MAWVHCHGVKLLNSVMSLSNKPVCMCFKQKYTKMLKGYLVTSGTYIPVTRKWMCWLAPIEYKTDMLYCYSKKVLWWLEDVNVFQKFQKKNCNLLKSLLCFIQIGQLWNKCSKAMCMILNILTAEKVLFVHIVEAFLYKIFFELSINYSKEAWTLTSLVCFRLLHSAKSFW